MCNSREKQSTLSSTIEIFAIQVKKINLSIYPFFVSYFWLAYSDFFYLSIF